MKKFLLVIVLVALAAVAVWYFGIAKNGQQPTTESIVYEDPSGRFSFSYPADFTKEEFISEAEDEIVLSKGVDMIQIFVSVYEDPELVTVEKINNDIPDLTVVDPKEILVDEKAVGVEFDSDITKEVWFSANDGWVYQISATPTLAKDLAEIIKNWKLTDAAE